MRQGRTSIIIAHRLSTIMDADLIVVMKDGEVAETGDPLMRPCAACWELTLPSTSLTASQDCGLIGDGQLLYSLPSRSAASKTTVDMQLAFSLLPQVRMLH